MRSQKGLVILTYTRNSLRLLLCILKDFSLIRYLLPGSICPNDHPYVASSGEQCVQYAEEIDHKSKTLLVSCVVVSQFLDYTVRKPPLRWDQIPSSDSFGEVAQCENADVTGNCTGIWDKIDLILIAWLKQLCLPAQDEDLKRCNSYLIEFFSNNKTPDSLRLYAVYNYNFLCSFCPPHSRPERRDCPQDRAQMWTCEISK